MKMTVVAAFAAISISAAGAASAATLVQTPLSDDGVKLFTTEIKRDKPIVSGGHGHDVFLRNGESFTSPGSFDFNWGASGTAYNWSVSYDGDAAKLVFDGREQSIDVNPDGTWNAVRFFLRADSPLFTTSKVSVNVTSANGSLLGAPLNLFAENGQAEFEFKLSGLMTIASLAGTVAFDFVAADGSTRSPNSRLAFNLKALEVQPIPVPAALPLLLTWIAGLGFMTRRRKAAAA